MTVENAYAKINLYLDVINKRADGFHDILSVMHTVSLCDRVKIEAITSDEREIRLSVIGADLPCDNRNIAYRAAEVYLDRSGVCSKINIEIEKNIPIGAGLAGGSTDAAATLRTLNRIYSRLTEEELLKIAADLGSDVPFCLVGGSAICEGRGDIMTPVNIAEKSFVIAIGEERVNTARAYGELDRLYSDFKDARPQDTIKAELMQSNDITTSLYNIFEDVAPDGVNRLKTRLTELSAAYVLMSGSGPSVFGIFDTPEQARMAADILNNEGYTAYFAKSVIDNSL